MWHLQFKEFIPRRSDILFHHLCLSYTSIKVHYHIETWFASTNNVKWVELFPQILFIKFIHIFGKGTFFEKIMLAQIRRNGLLPKPRVFMSLTEQTVWKNKRVLIHIFIYNHLQKGETRKCVEERMLSVWCWVFPHIPLSLTICFDMYISEEVCAPSTERSSS